MDWQRIEGGLKKATGSIKEQAGKAIGDGHLEGEGKAEKTGDIFAAESARRWTRSERLSKKSKPELQT